MDQQQVRWAVLKISMVALAVSTWVFMSFVFDTKPEFDEAAQSSVQVDPLVSLVRLPASIPAQLPSQFPEVFSGGGAAFDPIRMEVVKLGCWDVAGADELPVSARWVRITGRPCQSDTGFEAIRVRNMTNGYEGTVFASQKDHMTTDFIPLQQGSNDIRISVAHGDGVVVENQFTIVKSQTE